MNATATYSNSAATTTFVVTPPMTADEQTAWEAKFVASYAAAVKSMRVAACAQRDGSEGWEDALLEDTARATNYPTWAR